MSTYTYTAAGALDLRLMTAKKYPLEFYLPAGTAWDAEDFDEVVRALSPSWPPEVDFSGVTMPYHLSRRLMSYFPRAKRPGDLMLDLGCGTARHREVCEHAGFEYVGLDYDAPQAGILGDAHALPFKDCSFDFVLSMSVLEHIRFPFVAVNEVCRVLKPGGRFIGDVAFLEPFHSNSFYNHSHLGIWNLLRHGGFAVDRIAPSEDWSGLFALASMGLFPRMPRMLARSIVLPLHLLHRLWWWGGRRLRGERVSEHVRVRNTAGSFSFIARKTIGAEC